MDLGIKGKRALVCGASKGLGYACAEALAAEGADVILVGREENTLKDAAERIKNLTGTLPKWQVCDLLSADSRKTMIEKVGTESGGVDIIVHNVGGPKASTVEDTSIDSWQEGFDRLFKPVVELNQAFIPGMKERKWGRIVTITSLSVMEPIAMLSISNAMRSASTALSKTLSDEVAKHGITVNCVAPGLVQTDRTEELIKARIEKSGQTREQHEAEMHKNIPAARLGQPAEFGAVVCFLCSEKASYVTGSTICVDGGKRRSTY